ncbi:MAG: type I polyketide synthase, partial [Desulfatitalea sp.]|nr:hypothetical protein [Desulfatitalea sp.]NNK00776.1 type I polyketide synthase [Desulfatitalea sp.]
LDGSPHLAVSANVQGEDETLSLLKCLGVLAAAGKAVDLNSLYGYEAAAFFSQRPAGEGAIRVPVGGKPLVLPPLPLKARETKTPLESQELFPTGRRPAQSSPPEVPATANGFDEADPSQAWPLSAMLEELNANAASMARTHENFLSLSQDLTRGFSETFALQARLLAAGSRGVAPADLAEPVTIVAAGQAGAAPPAFTREHCMAFAIGSVGRVLGPRFDVIDTYPARVRLPDEPLMLVDRILTVEGEKCSLGSGRVITEHDVLAGAWYLDGGRAPVCIAVEAGQADLFLCSYLGIDHQVKGQRTYRLLDARVSFHRGLPRPGETIRYDIHIDKFVRQGATYLFFFHFDGYIGDRHLITMTDGCAGFFTEDEVRHSGGIILTDEDRKTEAALDGVAYTPLLRLADAVFGDQQIDALRHGDAEACFGPDFAGVRLPPALCLPDGRMRLIHRIVTAEPRGGRWGLGYVKAEADIHPDDWFLTCHFVDDPVMPGTLMYQCCAHALRVLLLRLGWVTDRTQVGFEPMVGVPCRLKCRGPVTPNTRKVHYVVEIKAIGYTPEPCVIADAHMYADGNYIVFFKDMSMRMSGTTQAEIQNFWRSRTQAPDASGTEPSPSRPLFTRKQILAFAVGNPSEAFGEPYRPFDRERRIARLPAPPYAFMDRITHIEPPPWVLQADGWIEAQYDVPTDAWYFTADRSGGIPFCVLLEIALQPCGWLAAYAGSALKSEKYLKFRNLGGRAVAHAGVGPKLGTLTMRTRMTKVSEAADMIIEHFDFAVLAGRQEIYTGTTYFGFFTEQALASQVGLREAVWVPDAVEQQFRIDLRFANEAPLHPDDAAGGVSTAPTGMRMPATALLMLDGIEIYDPAGGPKGLGYFRGVKRVDPSEWFFKAHFYQDPVCPGSLGIESFLQLIKYAAMARWPELKDSHHFEMACGREHGWEYRGQVIPSNRQVNVDAVITRIEDGPEPVILADGWLYVDGLCIYKMKDFGFRLKSIV